MNSLSTPGGRNVAYFRSTGSSFRDIGHFSKLPYLDMKRLAKVPKVAHLVSFYPKGSILRLFSLYGQPFSRDGPILKISIFGHKIWNLKKR